MDAPARWILGVVMALAIVALVLLARGTPRDAGHVAPTSPAHVIVVEQRG